MSFAATVRAWMKANPGPARSGEIADGLGLVGSARTNVTHALRNMLRDGYISATGTYGRRKYTLLGETARVANPTREHRRAMNKACQERYYWQRKGMTLEEGRAHVAAKRERLRLKQQARIDRLAASKIVAAERAATREQRRAEQRERNRAKDRERKAAARKVKDAADSERLRAMAAKVRASAAHAATIQAAIAKPVPVVTRETVDSFQARGGRVEVLPAPTYHRPHTIPAREIHHG